MVGNYSLTRCWKCELFSVTSLCSKNIIKARKRKEEREKSKNT